eukprot:gnl/Spiro4/24263_TR12043_c0_g1_i1.p1 gnl/Spiro4/24263_TR12043_c0_g1~~gnl/Spiro4/24263_TR12043_c0_g1_i1.p1  ORF type:complete len:316 (-),score=89.06 gnl/Spiro4/24263_TR12043_c0_g1_i1:61-1008(-)
MVYRLLLVLAALLFLHHSSIPVIGGSTLSSAAGHLLAVARLIYHMRHTPKTFRKSHLAAAFVLGEQLFQELTKLASGAEQYRHRAMEQVTELQLKFAHFKSEALQATASKLATELKKIHETEERVHELQQQLLDARGREQDKTRRQEEEEFDSEMQRLTFSLLKPESSASKGKDDVETSSADNEQAEDENSAEQVFAMLHPALTCEKNRQCRRIDMECAEHLGISDLLEDSRDDVETRLTPEELSMQLDLEDTRDDSERHLSEDQPWISDPVAVGARGSGGPSAAEVERQLAAAQPVAAAATPEQLAFFCLVDRW